MLCTRRMPLAATAALILALAFWASPAAAQSLVLSNLVVDNQAGSLMARFGVGVDGVAEVTENLQSGVTLALTCTARLARPGGMFGSAKVAEAEMVSRLKYDSLTREYSLALPGREAPLKNTRLDDLLRSGWGALTMDLGSWRQLQRGQEYDLTLDIKLHQTDIPNWFRRTLFFWSWDVIPATTYRLHFKY